MSRRRPTSLWIRRAARRLGRLGTAAAALALGACTVVSSNALHDVARTSGDVSGIHYALPMALVDISLYVHPRRAEFHIEVGPEHYVADPRQRYLLRYHPLPNYEDKIEIEVSSSSIISKVWSTTEDKTDEIVVDLAKAARSLLPRFQSGKWGDGALKLATVTIDPADPERVAHAAGYLNSRISVYADAAERTACRGRRDTTLCETYGRLRDPKRRAISLKSEPPEAAGPTGPPADCTVGICYRIKEPYVISYTVDGVRGASIVYAPNRAPLVELDVRRALFVQKIQKIDFDKDGFLKSAYVKKDSEVLAVAQLPISVLTAVSQALPLRLTIQQRQVSLAERRLAELEARRQLTATQLEAAGAGGGGGSGNTPQNE